MRNYFKIHAELFPDFDIFRLGSCNLSVRSFKALASALSSPSSNLRVLDLSDNVMDPGVQELAEGLKNPQCRLETLRSLDCDGDSLLHFAFDDEFFPKAIKTSLCILFHIIDVFTMNALEIIGSVGRLTTLVQISEISLKGIFIKYGTAICNPQRSTCNDFF